jgi:hypothetical protein
MAFRIHGFEWDEGNLEHMARHDVESDEVEEMFLGRT